MLSELEHLLGRYGLLLRGGFAVTPDDGVPDLPDGARPAALAMVGNAGSAIWEPFINSYEFADAYDDSLDRWTKRVLGDVASKAGLGVVYPFQGPPYYPFQRWAQRAEPVFSSPIGVLIHPEYGLWHAYRAALLLPEDPGFPERADATSPCDRCREKPCLSACPVDAFTSDGYDVAACASHLSASSGKACVEGGCRARAACPMGHSYVYSEDHLAFHMAAFVRSRVARN